MDYETLGATANNKQPVWVIHPDPQSKKLLPRLFQKAKTCLDKGNTHGLSPTYCHAVRNDITEIPFQSLFLSNRKVAATSQKDVTLSTMAEAVSQLHERGKVTTVLVPESIAQKITAYQKRYTGEVTLKSITPEESTVYPLPETKNPLTLPAVFVSDHALLASLDIPADKTKVVPTRITYYEEPSPFGAKQSRSRSNCYFIATLSSLMNASTTALLSNITLNAPVVQHCAAISGNEYNTFTFVFCDHYTTEPVPVTVTCDLLFDQQNRSLYDTSDVTLYPLIEKCFHGYLIAKTIQLTELYHQLTPEPALTLTGGIEREELAAASNDLLFGGKRTIIDLGRPSFVYKLLSLAFTTEQHVTETSIQLLLSLDEQEQDVLNRHITANKPAVIGAKPVFNLGYQHLLWGLKPNHAYSIVSTGKEVMKDNTLVPGFLIYDPYGEQHADIRVLKFDTIDEEKTIQGNLSSSALKFIRQNKLGALFISGTLFV